MGLALLPLVSSISVELSSFSVISTQRLARRSPRSTMARRFSFCAPTLRNTKITWPCSASAWRHTEGSIMPWVLQALWSKEISLTLDWRLKTWKRCWAITERREDNLSFDSWCKRLASQHPRPGRQSPWPALLRPHSSSLPPPQRPNYRWQIDHTLVLRCRLSRNPWPRHLLCSLSLSFPNFLSKRTRNRSGTRPLTTIPTHRPPNTVSSASCAHSDTPSPQLTTSA